MSEIYRLTPLGDSVVIILAIMDDEIAHHEGQERERLLAARDAFWDSIKKTPQRCT